MQAANDRLVLPDRLAVGAVAEPKDHLARFEACPVDAIFPEDQVPEEWQRFTDLNAAYFRVQAA